MAKSKTKDKAEATRPAIDWVTIETEWTLGQLDVLEIARQHGVSGPAIHQRAKRKGWPQRAEKIPCVTNLVTSVTRDADPVTEMRVALTGFHRVISLLHRHRKMLGRLGDEYILCMEDISDYRKRQEDLGRPLTLGDVDVIMNMVAKAAQALHKLVPLERRAFGLNDAEGVSEFDVMTEVELNAIENTVRKALDS